MLAYMAFWRRKIINPVNGSAYAGGGSAALPLGLTLDEENIFTANPILFAVIRARYSALSQARFCFERFTGGTFTNSDLAVLEAPWPGADTSDLLTRMEIDAALYGNFYCVRGKNGGLQYLAPPDVKVVLKDNVVIGYDTPAGIFEPADICHYAPNPSPVYNGLGVSWLKAVIDEVEGDGAATQHKLSFFRNSATSNLALVFDKDVSVEQAKKYSDLFKERHTGSANHHQPFITGGGVDIRVVGTPGLKENDFSVIQQASAVRIASAGGVPPALVGIDNGALAASGGLQASFNLFANLTLRPLWLSMAGSLRQVVAVTPKARLTVDLSGIPFLIDTQVTAEALSKNASTISGLIMAGFDPDAVVEAVASNDLGLLLGKHTGLYSVQLQPQGTN
jgi:phage portal protein BeeE